MATHEEIARPDWMIHARCHGLWELFDAERGDRKQALAVCHGCPVRDMCGEHAAAIDNKVGVWAGRIQGGVARREECGTPAGARVHYRLGEVACDGCRLAERDRVRRYRAAS